MDVLKSRGGKIVAGTVVVLIAAGGGAALASTQLGSPGARDNAIITDAAGQLGVQPGALSSALTKAIEDQIQAEVASGQLTQAQADALKAQVEAGKIPLFGGAGFGLGGGFGGRPAGGAFAFGFGIGGAADAAATYLGLSAAQIRTELQGGKTLAQIATAQGKTADGLVQAILTAQESNLGKLVSAGKLTADQEKTIEGRLQTMIENLVDGTGPTAAGPPAGEGIHFHGGLGARLGIGPFGADLNAAASYLGLTADQIETQLQGGKTLAQIATAQGKTADGLVQAILSAQRSNLDKLVTAGKLTADQEQTIEKGLTTMITNIVDGTRPAMGRFGPRRFEGGGFGFRRAARAETRSAAPDGPHALRADRVAPDPQQG